MDESILDSYMNQALEGKTRIQSAAHGGVHQTLLWAIVISSMK